MMAEDGAAPQAKRDWVPIIAIITGLLIQIMVVAYLFGRTTAKLEALMADVQEWKALYAPKQQVVALEGRIDRIDERVLEIERDEH
jgi:hypothetical protein